MFQEETNERTNEWNKATQINERWEIEASVFGRCENEIDRNSVEPTQTFIVKATREHDHSSYQAYCYTVRTLVHKKRMCIIMFMFGVCVYILDTYSAQSPLLKHQMRISQDQEATTTATTTKRQQIQSLSPSLLLCVCVRVQIFFFTQNFLTIKINRQKYKINWFGGGQPVNNGEKNKIK